jgi:serine/threonine protein kinase
MKIQLQAEQPQWFSSQEISALILPVLQALQTLTDAGLVHRDVKPENILFFNGQPCLGDISLLGADASVITRRGTPGYATPSWYQGGHPDMFGAAATLYALLTGNEPDKMGRTAFLWPPQGSDALSDQERAEWQRLHQIIRRATEERVTERFIDLNSMAREIRHEPPLKPKRTRLVIAGLSIAIVSTLALIAAKRAQTEDPDPIEVITTETTTKTVEEPETEETSSEELQPEPELTEAQKNDYHALAGMIQGYIVSRDYTNALATVEELLATYSQARNQPAFSIMRAMALIGLDRIDEARKELKRDIHVSPLIAPMTTRKEIWEKLGDLEAAEHDLSRILDAHGPATFTLFLRADIRAQRGNYAGVHADRGTAHKAFTDPLQAKLVDTMWKPLETKYPGYGEFVKSLAEKSQLQD